MKRYLSGLLIVVGLIGIVDGHAIGHGFARGGGGGNFMNSPGYQRRLQESRGYVTNRSTSVATPLFAAPHTPRQRDRRRR